MGMVLFLSFSCDTTEEPEPPVQSNLPVLSTKVITEITPTSAIGGGVVISNDGSNILESGICWSLTPTPTLNDSVTIDKITQGEFSSSLKDLLPDRTYYVRAYATNYDGTAYGPEVSFKTLEPTTPTLNTILMTIKNTSAIFNSELSSSGGSAILSKGFCWSETQNPSLSDNNSHVLSDVFTDTITNLTSGIKYYVRAYATNDIGTTYGNEIEFTTTIVDASGYSYNTVTIGNQVWMLENLKTTKYSDGTPIPNTASSSWPNITSGAWLNFTNNDSYGLKYGRLYNWYAVNNGVNDLAPEGWHVATDEEWTTLVEYLGGDSIAGGKLKETGYENWKYPNTGATNESGFTAISGGWTYVYFFNLGTDGVWWTSTEDLNNSENAWCRFMFANYENVERFNGSKDFGRSVRCIRDN